MEKSNGRDIVDISLARSKEAAGIIAALTVPTLERIAATSVIFLRSLHNTRRLKKRHGN